MDLASFITGWVLGFSTLLALLALANGAGNK
jgi:hypothetical protein